MPSIIVKYSAQNACGNTRAFPPVIKGCLSFVTEFTTVLTPSCPFVVIITSVILCLVVSSYLIRSTIRPCTRCSKAYRRYESSLLGDVSTPWNVFPLCISCYSLISLASLTDQPLRSIFIFKTFAVRVYANRFLLTFDLYAVWLIL